MIHSTLTHEQESTATLYALGSLDDAAARAFERHLLDDGCDACRAHVESMRGVVGDLALAPAPVAPPAGVRESLFARVAEAPRPHAMPVGLAFAFAGDGEWIELKPGVHTKELSAPRPGDRSHSYFVRMDPGAVLDRHGHECFEHCYVISGSAIIDGRRMRAGDYSYAPRGSIHEPVPSDEGAMLFIVETF